MTNNLIYLLSLALFLFLFVACSEDNSPVGNLPENKEFPRYFSLTGIAEGEDEGYFIEGRLNLIFNLPNDSISPRGNKMLLGNFGGHMYREILDSNGDGIALIPDVFAKASVELVPQNRIIIRMGSDTVSGSPFWDSTSVFKGSRLPNTDQPAEGKWVCAPFDITEGGWVDTAGTVEGMWYITPQ